MGRFRNTTSRSKVRSRIRFIRNQSNNPVAKKFNSDLDKFGTPDRGLQHRLHHLSSDRALSLLDQEQSDERAARARAVRRNSGELADEMGITGGEKVKVTSARELYIAKAMVTRRIKPMMIDGKKTYQIGIPIHWGYRGIAEDEGKNCARRSQISFRRRRSIPTPTRRSSRIPGEDRKGIDEAAWLTDRISDSRKSRPIPDRFPAADTSRDDEVCKYIDVTTCIGCKACEVACRRMERSSVPRDDLRQHLPDDAATEWNYYNLIKFDEQSSATAT